MKSLPKEDVLLLVKHCEREVLCHNDCVDCPRFDTDIRADRTGAYGKWINNKWVTSGGYDSGY